MCDPLTVAVVGAVAGAGISAYQGNQQAKAQKSAANQASADAAKNATLAEQDMNRRNQKKPNVGAITSGNQQAAAGGPAGTMLTGPSGIDPASLSLSKNTVLGL